MDFVLCLLLVLHPVSLRPFQKYFRKPHPCINYFLPWVTFQCSCYVGNPVFFCFGHGPCFLVGKKMDGY
jgi:hypothetical protein